MKFVQIIFTLLSQCMKLTAIPFLDIKEVTSNKKNVYPICSSSIKFCCNRCATTNHYYRPQRSWANVIFSQACVCPRDGLQFFGGGRSGPGGSPIFWGSPIFGGVSNFLVGVSNFQGGVSPIFFFFFFSIFFPPKKFFWDAPTRLPETVNARPVRILLEYIFVWQEGFHSYRFRLCTPHNVFAILRLFINSKIAKEM